MIGKISIQLTYQFFRDDMGYLRYRCDELGIINAYATKELADMIGEKLRSD